MSCLYILEKELGEQVLKHPLIVRLEQQIENLDAFVKYPSIGVANRHHVQKDEHNTLPAELHFDLSDKVKWPDHMSPTVIGTLAEHPFDYLMEQLLDITNDGKAKMADVKTTKGNVAHAIIEELFAPRNGARHSTPDEIESRIKNEYEKAYARILEAKGAVLQLAENRLAEKLLKEQLSTCLSALLEILRDNNLSVTGCEHHVESQMGLGLPEAFDDEGNPKVRDMVGAIDMTLEDEFGHSVVFDFKWTGSAKYYQGLLTENRSVQLELYRWMLGCEKRDQVGRVAYFLMPDAHLFSKEAFIGRHCTQLTAQNSDNIVEQLKQAALYRIAQINSGVVETNGDYDDLQYVKDTPAHGLFPLKKNEGDGTKMGNRFTKYGLFNH